jgi:hypothetical protein
LVSRRAVVVVAEPSVVEENPRLLEALDGGFDVLKFTEHG